MSKIESAGVLGEIQRPIWRYFVMKLPSSGFLKGSSGFLRVPFDSLGVP